MANSAANVSATKPKVGGAIYVAPIGTTLPETANETLNTAFKGLGYVSEEGVTNNHSPEMSEDIPTWDGDSISGEPSGRPDTFAYTLLEAKNIEVLKEVFGSDNVSGTLANGITIHANAKDLGEHSYVIDMILKDNTLYRIVIPVGRVTEVAERQFAKTGPIKYGITLKASPDENGDNHIEYLKAASTSSGGGTGEQT